MVDDFAGCVVTNGGPLVALPRELADAWRGTDEGGAVTDYERACEPPACCFTLDDSFSAWPVSVGDGSALVLEGECSTTAIRRDDGLVIVRDVGLASEAELITTIEAIGEREWVDCQFQLALPHGLVIFDAAYPGLERERADGGVLDADLAPGDYRVRIAYPRRGGRTTLVRLAGPSQGAAGAIAIR